MIVWLDEKAKGYLYLRESWQTRDESMGPMTENSGPPMSKVVALEEKPAGTRFRFWFLFESLPGLIDGRNGFNVVRPGYTGRAYRLVDPTTIIENQPSQLANPRTIAKAARRGVWSYLKGLALCWR